MERLTLNRRQKTTGDRVDCIPAGDGLPVWTTISLDAKLPMMSNPKGSVILYTTKLGEPKHQCKQEYDFDLRDPNGQYASNEYQPLHDPHLKAHFSTHMMRRHLIKKGFISEDGKVLCSLKEFNQYRQYLRHIYFLEIAMERKEELENRLAEAHGKAEFEKKASRGTVVRRRLQQQKERDINKLKTYIDSKSASLEARLKEIRDEMTRKERKQREEAERRQHAVLKHQQENEQHKLMLIKRWHQRDRMKRRLLEERETQRKISAELKCMARWNARKEAQRAMLQTYEEIMKVDDEMKVMNISRREHMASKKWDSIDRKLEKLKQKSREEKQKKDEKYLKRLDEKLASGDYRIYSRRRGRRRSPKKRFSSTWKLQDVLKTFEVPEQQKSKSDPELLAMLNAAIDDAVDIVTHPDQEDEQIQQQARNIVHDVISKVKNDIYPHYLQILDSDMKGEDEELRGENEALKSKSVRFSSDEEEIRTDLPLVDAVSSVESLTKEPVRLKPVSEHVLTPCASQLEIAKLEAEAILGSPEIADKITPVSFVETLLLRLLDDLNCGRLSKDDIMKLASYSMEIIQSAETDTEKGDMIAEVPEDSEAEGAYLASSSSSIIARKMVDFTLDKILRDIQNGNVPFDDLASLTVSFMDSLVFAESDTSVSISEAELDTFIDETIQRATSSAMDPRADSPICDAMLDDFMVHTLKDLIRDLEEEVLTKEQVKALAVSVRDEAKHIIPGQSDDEIEKTEDVQTVLHDVLRNLQSGAVDFQTMYQVVSAIAYSYSEIKAPETVDQKKITNILKEVLNVVEEKAGKFEEFNVNIVQEANFRLSNSDLNSDQVKDLSASVASVIVKPEARNTEVEHQMVEEALIFAKDKILNDESSSDLRQNVMDVAEAIINTLPSRESSFVDVFLDVLRQLKLVVDDMGTLHDVSGQDIENLIEQISSNEISEDGVLEMATTVARVIRSPIQSDSSFTASLAVKDCLKVALNDILDGSIEKTFLSEMIEALKSCCTAAGSKMRKTPAFLRSLSEFLRSVLDNLTYRIQTGDLNEEDVAELSAMFKTKMMGNKVEMTTKLELIDQPLQKSFETTDLTQLLHVLQDFVDATEKEGLGTADTKEIGSKLIEFGKRLVGTFGETASTFSTHSTDNFVEDVVEEVIRNLQIEIERGKLSKESLKEVTKVILDTTSASDIADEAVGHTIRGIHRDIDRGHKLSNIQSVPTLVDSPSASTVASQVVQQTIDSITRDISQRGIPREMITSLASSVVTALSGDECSRDNLPKEFTRFRPTITNIIDCLKKDQVSQLYAEEMFCLILEHYKTCVLGHKEQKDKNLPDEDADLVSNLIVETLQNIERSIAKGKMNNKSFSLPSLQHSDDTSFVADRLVDSCLENIREGFADTNKISAQPKHDLVDFILDIVTRLQSELAEGTISNLSMAHFYLAISDEEIDLKTLEMNASTNLTKVVESIKKFRGRSMYVQRILETYLIPDKISDDVFGDPLKAIESILVNVSSEILSKFVKATLQTILMGMREEVDYIHERSPSAYVLRSASSIIAENVIKEVIDRINSDMLMKVHKIHGTVSRQDIERAASRLLNESPRETTKKSSTAILTKKQSMSSVMSKEIEDIVLETLHNIVSNLRLEQSIQSQKGSKSSSKSNFSQEIEDFVLSTLQNIVVDHQDMRSQMDMGVTRSGSKYAASSIELVTGESKEAMAYVNEVLQNVLAEMKAEIVESANETTEKYADADSANIQTLILEYLQRALNDTHGQEGLASCMELFSPDDVKKVLLETISSTIQNVKENKFSQADLETMFDVSRRFLEEADPECEIKQEESVTPDIVVNLLENVKRNIKSKDIQKKTFDNISSQLATLGMAVASETSTPVNIRSESSVESSLIGDLIKDVLVRISKQLFDSEHGKTIDLDSTNAETKNMAQENTNNNDKDVSKSSSKTSDNTNDVNYNRKFSVSTANSCTSNITSVTNKSNEENENLKKVNDESKNQVFSKKVARNKSLTKQERKLTRRSTENKPVIRCSTTPSGTETISKTAVPRKLTNQPQSEEVRRTHFVSFIEKATPKGKTKASKEITPKRIVKGSVSENKTTTEKKLTPTISSSTFTRKLTGTGKSVAKTKIKNKAYKIADRNESNKGQSMPSVAEVPEGPLELKSLCGVHKTKVCYREQQCDSSTKSNDSDNIKSSLN